MSLEIQEGEPPQPGTYVVYVDDDIAPNMPSAKRLLMLWHHDKWHYPLSSVSYRGHVYGWIGPIPVMRLYDDETNAT